ncbi:MAG: hypothetical protein VYA34_05360 [Myxococcota bacterium]|nr:hypothetical protein [Myxococcota bacterium]
MPKARAVQELNLSELFGVLLTQPQVSEFLIGYLAAMTAATGKALAVNAVATGTDASFSIHT